MNAVELAKEKVLKPKHPHEQDEFAYRSISKAAIVSLVFAILGVFAFIAPLFSIIPLLGVCFGLLGLANLKRYPNELIGYKAALIGTIGCLLSFVGSVGLHSYIYATEVPEGHTRISFYQLRPDEKTSLKFAEMAKEIDGEKVFLKGYIRPSAKKENLSEFILVGDFGSCCFGGNPKPTDIVSINIVTDQKVDYSFRLRKIIGTFKLNKNPRPVNEEDVPSVFYEISADQIK